MNPSPQISVIVPCRGHARELEHCLRALQIQQVDVPYEVIVVDSAADPAVAAAAAPHNRARVFSSPDPLFAEGARNLGVDNSQGEILAFTDADCVPAPGWLAAALAALRGGAMLVGGAVGDALPGHLIAISDNLLQFADFSPHRPDQAAEYFPACNFALTREGFNTLGRIPEPGPLMGADTLYSQAAVARWPGQVLFVRAMRVDHQGRTTLGQMWPHMHSFGYGRARLNIRMRPGYRRLGRSSLMVVPIAARRWLYLAQQIARWHPAGLLRFFALTPFIVFGLLGWAVGFRDGCREPIYQDHLSEKGE